MTFKKYFIKVFGCQMNVADGQRVTGWYEQRGWKRTDKREDADEAVIVTCSVRQTAEDRVYGQVNNLAKLKIINCKLKIVVTGCMLRYPLRFLKEKMPQVDEFKKISDYPLNSKFKNLALRNSFGIRDSSPHVLVPIMEGCNNFCSYCVVPYARGREISRPFEEIVCEVEELVKRGYKEILLLGQNVNSYKPSFALLLVRLHDVDGIEKISFLTSNPWDLDDEIIEVMALPKIDRYLHLPVQSGDDEILKKMNRKYMVKQYVELVEKIRKRIPDIKIGTDIIVGFPGETEEQFQNTVDLCKKVGFVKAYVSKYSPRLQTAAYKLKDDVSQKEKRRRWKVLDDSINKS